MSDQQNQGFAGISTLEQARQGIITRWDEMRTHDTDMTAFQMKIVSMYSELSFLIRPDEKKDILATLKNKNGEMNQAQSLAKVLELLSPIYYERVVSARWDLAAGVSTMYGEAAKASQQSLLNIFWGFDVLSIQHVYTFIKKVELILMNEANYKMVYRDITHMVERWEHDWGNFPIGLPKALELPFGDTSHRGPETDMERAYNDRDPDMDRTGVDMKLDFNEREYRLHGMTYFTKWLDDISEHMPLRVSKEHELRDEEGKLTEDASKEILDQYQEKTNLRDLLFGDPLQLIPYRKTHDYQLALRQLHFILQKAFVLLKDCEVHILRDFVPYEDSVAATVSTYKPKQR